MVCVGIPISPGRIYDCIGIDRMLCSGLLCGSLLKHCDAINRWTSPARA
jgi:hypothetical protein